MSDESKIPPATTISEIRALCVHPDQGMEDSMAMARESLEVDPAVVSTPEEVEQLCKFYECPEGEYNLLEAVLKDLIYCRDQQIIEQLTEMVVENDLIDDDKVVDVCEKLEKWMRNH